MLAFTALGYRFSTNMDFKFTFIFSIFLIVVNCSPLNFSGNSTSAELHKSEEAANSVADKLKKESGKPKDRKGTVKESNVKALASLTDDVLDQFQPDGNIDYDSMEGVQPQKLVPDAENSTFPESEIVFKQMHERAQFMRIEEIKSSILSKLRLQTPPNVTALKLKNKLKRFPQHILPRTLDDLAMQSDDTSDSKDEFHARISTVIQFASSFPSNKHPENFPVESIAYFEIPLSVSQKNLQKAMLLVYIGTPPGKEGTAVELKISSPLHKSKYLTVREVKLTTRGHWEHIDISHQVREWAAYDDNNYGLIITAELDGVNLVHLEDGNDYVNKKEHNSDEDITKLPHRAPLIKMTLNENEGRHKRSFDEVPFSCEVGDREKRCCRYKFVIDFEQMGPDFDFILQPKRYLANYCAGTCPTYYLPSTAGSHLLMGFSRHKLQRCCTPTKVKPLEILYIDDNGSMVTGRLPGMTIEKCDCS